MDIDNLTIGQAKEIAAMFNIKHNKGAAKNFIGQYVIVRTNSAGVWCGMLYEKEGTEVVLKNARRMWKWWCKESISLSAVVVHGIDRARSLICPPVNNVWLDAIELIPIEGDALESIMGADNAEAEQ